jgi:hypothetical protein
VLRDTLATCLVVCDAFTGTLSLLRRIAREVQAEMRNTSATEKV